MLYHTARFGFCGLVLNPELSKLHQVNMSEAAVTVRVRKFMRNPLLKRRQMVICLFGL